MQKDRTSIIALQQTKLTKTDHSQAKTSHKLLRDQPLNVQRRKFDIFLKLYMPGWHESFRLASCLIATIEWFSNRTGTSVEDGISRGIVWTLLPVLFLTSQGWTRVAFATAFSVFSRRKENGKFPQAFIKFFKKKGKNCFPQCLKWYSENLLVVFWKYWPSLLRMSLTNAKVLFLHQANVLCSLTKWDSFIGWTVFSYKLLAERYGE